MVNKCIGSNSDKTPDKFWYVRYNDKSVRPELYSVMHKLSSKFQMSNNETEGSIITIANTLFGRKWRPYTSRKERDLNKLPSMKYLVHNEPCFEAMILSSTGDEMMSKDIIKSII